MTENAFTVGARITFKYDKRAKYGTVIESRQPGRISVEWDHPHPVFGHPHVDNYSGVELRAVRPREEGGSR